uniref:Uncharacterized protein n=1 Tax=Chelonoidis abingdonii TaxID=106734 RepID=A0A8C0FZ55_CHEAB
MNVQSKSKISMITAVDWVEQFGSQVLHANGDKLFCTSCHVSLDHTRRATHHLNWEMHCWETKRKKNKTISSLSKKTTESSETRHLAIMELVDAFASADILLEKPDRPKLREFIQQNVQYAGCLPSANKLRQDYLPKALHTF